MPAYSRTNDVKSKQQQQVADGCPWPAVLEAAAAADSSEDVDDHHLLYLLGEVAWGFESAAPPELLPIGL
ncbi:hypothetical protein HaLaN_01978 [Haematococcus lacustris]|uniref:Uncharacterized protein n=1 Tax=Haematococcus lacustris TaxID=44745 RepID=A0A699YMC1_HAELA|nr:hypothetical protein HaLaN_01978 [Haematococcus lacustris]